MKREIRCCECRNSILKRYKLQPSDDVVTVIDPYPEEHIKIVRGTAIIYCMCDTCGKEISPGDECFAVSTWADYGGTHYYEWEEEYINIPAERKVDGK